MFVGSVVDTWIIPPTSAGATDLACLSIAKTLSKYFRIKQNDHTTMGFPLSNTYILTYCGPV